jgi:hypothetical protein
MTLSVANRTGMLLVVTAGGAGNRVGRNASSEPYCAAANARGSKTVWIEVIFPSLI